jgi:hypothetical protein
MNAAKFPCPICHRVGFIVGANDHGKIMNCGHVYSFRSTRSQKVMDRTYETTPWGLERKPGK